MPKEEQKVTGYLAFTPQNKVAVNKTYDTSSKFESVQHASAGLGNVRTRDGYHEGDYYRQRTQDIVPSRFRDVIYACRKAYLQVGVVRNVIDLMTDFACEDLKIIHPDKKVEAFFKVWMAKIKLKDAIDEFVRHFFIDGNVVVKRYLARLSKPVEDQWMEKTMKADDPEKLYVEDQVGRREIPWRYSFLNVSALYWMGGEAAQASGDKQLAFRPSESLVNAIRTPSDDLQRSMVNNLPIGVRNAVSSNSTAGLVPLDMEELYIAHNKKDSWEDWAPPYLYAVLSDIAFKHKLRQAEISAMDGWINVIRLWKLGDHKEGFFPGTPVVEKLLDLLQVNTGGGVMDIVWDSMIDVKELYPPVKDILGEEKYTQVNKDILIGLGVPEVLIGGEGANFSNSFIQLKTLVEKLNYVRDKLKDWLYQEVHLVCRAMDIPVAPKIRFNQMNLEDESVTRKLIIELLDRGIISVEAVLQVYGEDILIEAERIRGEKAIFKDAGIKVKSPLDPPPVKPGIPGAKAPGTTPNGGKPVKTTDVGRKPRKAKPLRATELTVKALDIIDIVDNHIVPLYMESEGVANARRLTAEQKDELNTMRMVILASIKPDQDITEEHIVDIVQNSSNINNSVVQHIQNNITSFASNGILPTLAQRKRIEAASWAEYYNEEIENA
jgi:hypothetical protein